MDVNLITNKEVKIKLAQKILSKVEAGQTIGFGSGSTSYLAALEIIKVVKEKNIEITAVTTSEDMEELCKENGIKTITLSEAELNWAFDGADEVDERNRLIKGKGGAMFREKLNMISSPITYILVDNTKLVKRLGETSPIPVEVFPSAIKYVSEKLEELGSTEILYRGISENGNAILDARFENIEDDLEKKLKVIPGVIETGLFIGYNVEIIKE